MAEKKPVKEALRKFDYKLTNVNHGLPILEKEKILDALGAEGWELIAFHGDAAVFKRLYK